MKTWEYTATSARRFDGLEVTVRQGIRRTRVSVGFADTHSLTMDEWRSLWLTFVPKPPWNEERVERSLRGLIRPQFLFEPNEPWERLVESIDRLVAVRESALSAQDKQIDVLNGLYKIEQLVQQLIERLKSES